VRFTIAGEGGGNVAVCYVLEREHRPVEHGSVEVPLDAAAEVRASNPLRRQAEVFAQCYRQSPRRLAAVR
jgi:hypothetical protein